MPNKNLSAITFNCNSHGTLMGVMRQAGIDLIVPRTPYGLEPLCAVYAKRCLEVIENRLQRGDYRIRRFFDRVRVKHVSEKRLRRVDPDLLSFKNVNTPEDLAEVAQYVPLSSG